MVYRTYRRRRRGSSRRSGFVPARTNHWVRLAHTNVPVRPLVPGLYGVELLPATAVDPGALTGATVVRTRIDLMLISGPVTNSAAGYYTGVALGADPDNMQPGSPPGSPNSGNDWMHWRWNPLSNREVGLFIVGNPATSYTTHQEIDVKVSRRIADVSWGLYLMLQLSNYEATPAVTVNLASSVLFKK